MKNTFVNQISKVFILVATLWAGNAFALPKATELVASMGLGYNIGNTMEAPGNPTAWGNSLPTEAYVKAIKDAGFSSVRIPCAWNSHAKDGVISEGWLDTVKTVVDLVVDNGMYAVLNSHWDNGWLEDHVWDGDGYNRNGIEETNKANDIAALQEKYWTQIANKFKNYDEKLIFASANEPGVNDPRAEGAEYGDNGQWTFDEARMKVLRQYHEACIKGVRATGGNNATRTIIVQAPRTEMDMASMLSTNMPTDPAGAGYIMAEFHYYPYQYSLMTADEDWGKQYYYYYDMPSSTDKEHNMGWDVYSKSVDDEALGTPKQIAKAFGELKTMFCDKGIPVVIGEMGAIKRTETLSGENLKLHLEGRAAWYGEVVKAAKANGIIPCVWDTGHEGYNNMTFIRRQDEFGTDVGTIVDLKTLNAMRKEYGMTALSGNINTEQDDEDNTDKMLEVKYTTKTSDSSEVGTLRINVGGKDWSKYTAISFQAKVDINSAGPAKGEQSAWTSLSMFAMSGSTWTWSDFNFEKDDIDSAKWKTYTVPLSATGLNIGNKANVQAFGIILYGTQITGTIDFDNFILIKADGTYDVLQDFDTKPAETDGIASGILKSSTVPATIPETVPTNSSSSHIQNTSSSSVKETSSSTPESNSSSSKSDIPEKLSSSSHKAEEADNPEESSSSHIQNSSSSSVKETSSSTPESNSSSSIVKQSSSSEAKQSSSSKSDIPEKLSSSSHKAEEADNPEESSDSSDESEEPNVFTAGKWTSTNTKIALDDKDLFIGAIEGSGNRIISRNFTLEKGTDYLISFNVSAEDANGLEMAVKLTSGKTDLCKDLVSLTTKNKKVSCNFTATRETATLTLTVLGNDGFITISNFSRQIDTEAIQDIKLAKTSIIRFENNSLLFTRSSMGNTNIQIFDPMGNCIRSQTIPGNQGIISLNQLPRGRYIVKAITGNQREILSVNIR